MPTVEIVMATLPATVPSASALRQHLRRLADEISRAMRINLEPAGLTVDEWSVLDLLGDGQGHAMAEVASVAGVPGPTATRMVDRLTSQALIHRTVDPADGRRVLVALAPRGRELHTRLAPAQQQLSSLIADRIGRQEFGDLYERLRAANAGS
ncbi:MarR family winged helix-turn-helix transcriptional regulator [Nocardioides maradonensis]